MKFGIIQGRLSPPDNGFQECPVDWKREFDLLDAVGLSYIEWIITKESFATNPFLSFAEDLSSYPIKSVCADNLVDKNIHSYEYLRKNLEPICESALVNGVECVTIPLLEDSHMETSGLRDAFKDNILKIHEKYSDLVFSFEAELPIAELCGIVSEVKNFKVTYDTGNTTSYGLDHGEYISTFHNKINNIHLKDRTLEGKTVTPGTGETPFGEIFEQVKAQQCGNEFTLQSARGISGEETQTIQNYIKLYKGIYNDS
jgi:hypothetical protein